MAASLIVPRGADRAESKHVVVMKTEAVAQAVASTVARIVSTTDYTYSNLFNGFSASLTKSELKDLLNDPNVDFIEKDHTTYTYDESAGQGTCTYVLDTGIEVDHPEFEGRARFVQNFVDNADLDANGHGTHIAGSIGSKTYGVAKKTQLFAVKVLNEYTAGQTSGILAGMDFIIENAATRKCSKGIVINMPLSVASSPAINATALYRIKDIKASELCNLIATMSLKDVIKGIPENTVNVLIQNGEAK
ncbi:hypothetical protein J7337_003746 [Fusarium musae]|uniref:Uncharacterized protein n=1 Tax=Fusarium musae TaxID=1042133 RepID=A0A9P8DKX1_9HYPO|nr:hypothetical protein J7337_003746 [Fusarium musae]KAG9503789.1 hypothetical protein J7337_003746 [Fusarium musae]